MTAAAGDWFAVPRRGRVDDAVGATLGAVRGAGGARARRRGMVAAVEGAGRVVGGLGRRRQRVGSTKDGNGVR